MSKMYYKDTKKKHLPELKKIFNSIIALSAVLRKTLAEIGGKIIKI